MSPLFLDNLLKSLICTIVIFKKNIIICEIGIWWLFNNFIFISNRFCSFYNMRFNNEFYIFLILRISRDEQFSDVINNIIPPPFHISFIFWCLLANLYNKGTECLSVCLYRGISITAKPKNIEIFPLILT